MKKLLALVLVLAMVSAASAGTITITPADSTADVDTDVVITVVTTGYAATFPGAINILEFSITGDLDSSVASVGTLDTALQTPLFSHGSVGTGGTLISMIQGNAGTGNYITNQTIYTFTVDVGSTQGTLTIDVAEGYWFRARNGSDISTTIVAGEIEVVPEPMTVALLGLGGLFLRRRRS